MIAKAVADRLHYPGVISRAAIILCLMLPLAARASDPGGIAPADRAMVERALGNELRAVQDAGHPMQYRLRKSSPRLTSARKIIETKDGAVARLLTINDNPLGQADRQKDDARLDALLADPSRQRRRKQTEQDDTGKALKVLRALPKAFLYEFAGSETNGPITLQKYSFKPNPKFNSADLELLVLTAMSGILTVDATHERVVRLEGHLQKDVDIGWGILGRMNHGGWITIEQADVGGGVWRIVRFQMAVSGRVFFKTRSFDTLEEQSQFEPVPAGMTYQQAIQMLRSDQESATVAGK